MNARDELVQEALHLWYQHHAYPLEERMRFLVEGLEPLIADQAFRDALPPCPGCGCVTPDDPDRHECGCDLCDDGTTLPPGVVAREAVQ